MPVNPVQFIQNNLTMALTGALLLVLIAWAYDALEDAEDRREAARAFGGNAKSGVGSWLNVVLMTIVAMVGWAATTFQTAGEAIAYLLTLAPDAPVFAASLATIGLGALGLSDMVVIQVWHFVAISSAIVLLALAYRTDFGKVGLP